MVKTFQFSRVGVMCLLLSGCGVKGPPQPPLTPPELGRGQPTFKRAAEGLTLPEIPPIEAYPDRAQERQEQLKETSGGKKKKSK